MKQNQYAILIGIAILVLVAVGGVVLLKKFPTIPANKKQTDSASVVGNQLPLMDENGNIVGDVKATSELPGYTVNFPERQKLIALLNQWRIFGKTYTTSLTPTPGAEVIHAVHFVLTKKEQKTFMIAKDATHVYSSVGLSFAGPEMVIKVQIAPQLLPQADNYFELQALHIPYGISHPYQNGDKNAYANGEKAYNDFITDKNNKKIMYLTVTKK
jgi:hypothetical protein